MENAKKNALLGTGAVVAAFGASLCCILPVAVAVLGIGSAALGAKLEPFRPYFVGLTLVLLGFAFYESYRAPKCGPDEACAVPENRTRQRLLLWSVAVVALALMAFPYYASRLF